MRYLRARLYQVALDEAHEKEAATRRAQLGTGERSEKIRTYNFREERVTDHRIKYTSHQLQDVLAGGEELDGFADRLLAAERSRAALRGQGLTSMRPAEVVAARSGLPRTPRRRGPSGERRGADDAGARRRPAGLTPASRVSARPRPGVRAGPVSAAARDAVAAPDREQGFRHLVLTVRPGVFVPRPETEVLVDVALELLEGIESPCVVDLCTGSAAPSPSRSPTNVPARA
jgi:hypothetical protein